MWLALISFLCLTDSVWTTSNLRVCPFDQAVHAGETVHLRCASTSEPGRIRWFYGNNVIYTGKEVIRSDVNDTRLDVRRNGKGSADIYIAGVELKDAGVYTCRDMESDARASVNLIVVDPVTESVRTANVHSQSVLERGCSFTYHGPVEPEVEWLDIEGNVLENITCNTNVSNSVAHSTTRDPAAVECRLVFQLFSCGHAASVARFAFNELTNRQADEDAHWLVLREPIITLVCFVWAATVTVILVVVCCVACCAAWHNRCHHTKKYPPHTGYAYGSAVNRAAFGDTPSRDSEAGDGANGGYSDLMFNKYQSLKRPQGTTAADTERSSESSSTSGSSVGSLSPTGPLLRCGV